MGADVSVGLWTEPRTKANFPHLDWRSSVPLALPVPVWITVAGESENTGRASATRAEELQNHNSNLKNLHD